MRPLRRTHPARLVVAVLATACIAAAAIADAKTLRWANRGDMQTTDPHSQNEGLTNNVNSLIYEFLVDRDKKLDIRPSLAESWHKVNDTTWRVKLRPSGIEITLDCPNNRYVNDEKICQALAAMWSQIGVMTKVNAMPRANYFPKLEKLDTSLYMLGWGGPSTDAMFTLQPVLSTNNGKGDGDYNYGRYTNPKLDALAFKARTEMNPDARLKFIQEALAAHNAEINHLPLHRQVIPWASRSNITVVHRADNFVTPYWVKMQ